jgi:hypothetical protein
MDGFYWRHNYKVEKYRVVSFITFGANKIVETMVGIAMIAYIPSIKLITIEIETVAPRIVDRT